MSTRLMLLAALALVAGLARLAQAQDTLQSWRDDSRSSAPSVPAPSSNRSNSRDDHCDDDDDESFLDSVCGDIIGSLLSRLFEGAGGVESLDERSSHTGDLLDTEYFVPYYKHLDADWYEGRIGSSRARIEYQDDFDSVWRMGFHSLFTETDGLGWDIEANYWREQIGLVQHDDLWTGDVNVLLPVMPIQNGLLRIGGGMNWLSDRIGTEIGYNGTLGIDLFPARPWILSGEMDIGTVGKASLFHGRATVGVMLKRIELYTGFDYFKVGGKGSRQLVSGLRIWF